ncbi:hypothetical protein [Roseibium algae]|uniref:Transposase n=1 Tax=Roseibium algae TaxID=3123038 RepID=A0ABU8TK71_9HYPH
MFAQNELKDIFVELEQSTDRALEGIQTIRSSSKLDRVPPTRCLRLAELGALSLFLYMAAHWIQL